MYPALPKSYKGFFPFKIGTTSFIYPDGYVQNVRMLGPYLDEIELLLFESALSGMPSHRELRTLYDLSKAYDLAYNIHLPTDISLSDPDPSSQNRAITIYKEIIKLTSCLSPSTYTLHLPFNEKDNKTETVKRWQERIYTGMKQLAGSGINKANISIRF